MHILLRKVKTYILLLFLYLWHEWNIYICPIILFFKNYTLHILFAPRHPLRLQLSCAHPPDRLNLQATGHSLQGSQIKSKKRKKNIFIASDFFNPPKIVIFFSQHHSWFWSFISWFWCFIFHLSLKFQFIYPLSNYLTCKYILATSAITT